MLTMGRHGSGHPDGPIGHSSAAFVTCSVIILLMVNLYLIYTIYYRKKYFSYYWIKKNGDSQLTLREPQEVDEDKDSSSEDDDEKESESQLDDDEASYKPNVQVKKLSLSGMEAIQEEAETDRQTMTSKRGLISKNVEINKTSLNGSSSVEYDRARQLN